MAADLSILIVLHFVSDFFFQPGSWARGKIHHFKPLLYHSIQYTIPFLIAFYFMKISLWWSLLIFGVHMAIDNRKLLDWWNELRHEKDCPGWIEMIQDQAIHIIAIMVVWFLN
jgi:hypothetical protein